MSILYRFCLILIVTSSVVVSAPCTTPAAAPCAPTTTKRPCVHRTTTTTTTSTTTTPAPCVTTTVAMAQPCEETTTVAFTPCETTTAAFNPCTTTTTTTTPVPCETTTVALIQPCETTTVAQNPCETTTVALNPCETTTVAQNPCGNVISTTQKTKQNGIDWQPYDNNRLGTGIQIDPKPPVYPFEALRCDDGWVRFDDSCYYVERDQKKTLRQAEEHCRALKSSLFVANRMEEYKTIFENAPLNTWTWLGLRKEDEDHAARWQVDDSIDINQLNWLNNSPYGDAINGWTSVSQCAAHWNPSSTLGKYLFFYPCDYSFNYVCEKNATELSIHSLF